VSYSYSRSHNPKFQSHYNPNVYTFAFSSAIIRCNKISMRSILILSLILAFTITYAQDRKDTIRMKDGAEILCQILKVSKPDSIIQFCIRENGELKVKKVQTAYVVSYAWPGKYEADTYSKMLGAKTIHHGEIYKGYWPSGPPTAIRELTSSEMATKELNKASVMVRSSFAVITAGLFTAIFVPKFIHEPTIKPGNKYSYPDDYKRYENTINTLQIVGYGVVAAGAIIGLSSIPHFRKARLLKLQSGNELSFYHGRDGLCLVFRF